MSGSFTGVTADSLVRDCRAYPTRFAADDSMAEHGTHDILLARGGLCARLAALQFDPAEERA